jgi:hypothetical protein
LIVERTLLALATAAAVVAAVAVAIVSAFFALFALVEPHIGRAGAGAVVSGVAALLAALIAIIAAARMEGDKRRAHHAHAAAQPAHDPGLINVVMNVVKDRPLLSAGAAVAVGLYALKNPTLVSAVIRGFMETRPKS